MEQITCICCYSSQATCLHGFSITDLPSQGLHSLAMKQGKAYPHIKNDKTMRLKNSGPSSNLSLTSWNPVIPCKPWFDFVNSKRDLAHDLLAFAMSTASLMPCRKCTALSHVTCRTSAISDWASSLSTPKRLVMSVQARFDLLPWYGWKKIKHKKNDCVFMFLAEDNSTKKTYWYGKWRSTTYEEQCRNRKNVWCLIMVYPSQVWAAHSVIRAVKVFPHGFFLQAINGRIVLTARNVFCKSAQPQGFVLPRPSVKP